MLRILIVDDHPFIRAGLISIISDKLEAEIEEAGSGSDALKLLENQIFDLLILDLNIPDISGLNILEVVQSNYKNIKVLVLSAMPEEQYGIRIIKAGADGYMHKESAPNDLIKAINKILSGSKYISSALSDLLLNGIDKPSSAKPHESLSDREFQVLRMVGEGKSISDIAEILFLSPNTISTYRTRILHKLNLESNSELIKYCLNEKLIDNI